MGLQAGGVLDGDDALVGRLVRERRAVHEVADRPDAVGRGAHALVDLDHAALADLHAGLVEAEPLDVGRAAGGDAQVVEALRAVAPVELDRVLADAFTFSTARAGHDLHVLLAELGRDDLRDLGVLERQDLVEHLDQDHLGPEAAERGGDLGARGAGADHREPRGLLVQQPHARRVEHAALEAGAGDRQRHRARSRARPSPPRPRCPSTATLALAGQRRRALEHVDLVLLHQPGDAAGERLHDLVAVLAGARDVELEIASRRCRTRRRRAPRRARRPRAASPSRGCRPRSGSGRRARLASRRPRSSCRPARRGSRPRSRPGPDPITTMSYLSAIAGSLTSGSLHRIGLARSAGGRRPASGCGPALSPGTRTACPRRAITASATSSAEQALRLDQQQRPDHDQEREQRLEAEHRPVARAPHAGRHAPASAPRRRSCPTRAALASLHLDAGGEQHDGGHRHPGRDHGRRP